MIARRPRLWWGFGLGSAVLLGALAWASVAVYRLEARTAEQRALSQRQEVIRRALWRVDSQLAPIIAMEAARPVNAARFDVPGDVASDQAFGLWSGGRSPNSGLNQFNRGFFVIEPDGSVNATDAETRTAAVAFEREQDAATLESIGAVAADRRNKSAPAGDRDSEPETSAVMAEADAERGGSQETALSYDFAARQQVANIAKQSELSSPPPQRSRADSMRGAAPPEAAESAKGLSDLALEAPADSFAEQTIGPSRIEAVWVTPEDATEPELLLVRLPDAPGVGSQGVRLDWPALRTMLETSVADLLPTTTLVPARGEALRSEREGRAYRLATIPALLVPGGAIAVENERMTPAFWALLVTWLATLIALIAVAMVLHATLRLSDRRARFVGAVTHELRTPLTTFRLYAQMLAGGMVTDENARAEYLGTLERESVRLGEIVENVLEYARLTRRRPGDARPPGERSISPSELITRVRPVLSRRAEQSGMDLIVSIDATAEAEAERSATCDPRSVERILMNLVENACKYAAPPEAAPDDDADTRIHLDVSATDRSLEILVADHGPGVPARQRERVFGEFQRGPGAAESSRPGLGLGLALSRGLAREMGGDLRLVRRREHGAEFLLTVPLDPPPEPAASRV